MPDNLHDRLAENDERAAAEHASRLEQFSVLRDRQAVRHAAERATLEQAVQCEERAALIRAKVREICGQLLDPQNIGDWPRAEVLVLGLNWIAGTLACQDLDESAGLKVRRLGRRMDMEEIVF